MFKRSLLFFGVLVAAVAVPYVFLDGQLAQTARGQWDRLVGKAEKGKKDLLASLPAAAGGHAAPSPSPASPTIEQAFRFDLSPQWVSSRWPRVSTVAGDPKQLGMRVALVTGTRPDDVAGSLTYYFDEHHQLQRLTFTGLTGDPRRLLTAVVTPHGLKSQPTTGAAHYIAGDPKHPTSEVIVRHLPVVANSQPARMEASVDLHRSDVMTWREKAEREPEVKLLPTTYRRW
jgi:hypothetical protein